MVYFEIMWDWVMTMHFVSGSNRAMDKLRFFGGRKQSSEERLVGEIEALERQVCLLFSFCPHRHRQSCKLRTAFDINILLGSDISSSGCLISWL